jgi:type IV secretion system protein VirD4
VPPSDINRTKPLIRLILNQVGRRLTEDLKPKAKRHRLLLMLDEFPALGRLDFFESALAFMAGYGIKSFLIAQSLNQIEKAYGANNAILDNCHVRVASPPTTSAPPSACRTRSAPRPRCGDEELCRAPAVALAGHLMVSRRRPHGRCSRRARSCSFRPPTRSSWSRASADPREEGALLRGRAVPRTHPAAAEAGRPKGGQPPTNDWSALPIAASRTKRRKERGGDRRSGQWRHPPRPDCEPRRSHRPSSRPSGSST